MSLVPTWVKAVDGKYYKDPILRGEDWFLCFDDDDPPELVVKHELAQGRHRIRKRQEEILAGLGFPYQTCFRSRYSGRCFLTKGVRPRDFSLHPAAAIFLIIQAPIPIPEEYDEIGTDPNQFGECVIYNFEYFKGK